MSKLIEKEGKFYKECGVVMLETDKHSPIALEEYGRLKFIGTMDDGYIPTSTQKTQHLYITSDDEIKDGDWVYYKNGSLEGIHQVINGQRPKTMILKKIIATTDELKLKDISRPLGVYQILPSPSESFIKAYIEAYNNGNVIEDVLVECEEIIVQDAFKRRPDYNTYRIKLKDNNIIIKKMKDSWTREEMCSNMQQYMEYCKFLGYITPQQWIEENL
jgi:hypothetical protein